MVATFSLQMYTEGLKIHLHPLSLLYFSTYYFHPALSETFCSAMQISKFDPVGWSGVIPRKVGEFSIVLYSIL